MKLRQLGSAKGFVLFVKCM